MLSSMLCVLSAALILSSVVSAQFVSPPTNLKNKTGYAGINIRYKNVPKGICELDPKVRSIAGYADVGTNEHLFFWFFEARTVHPKQAPLTVWINGGPGSSSMLGLFQENGPCRIQPDGTVISNPYSWSNVSNMLYIDQPVGAGFSYSEAVNGFFDGADLVTLPAGSDCPDYADYYGGCVTASYQNASLTANSTQAAAPNMWKALQGFMGAFPAYARHGFHFATESNGGHYGPVFNEYFEQQNAANIPGAMKISLESVAIGNGWFEPNTQYQAFYNFTVDPGNTYDLHLFNSSIEAQMYNALYGRGNCVDQTEYCASSGLNEICSQADDFCYSEVEALLDNIAGRDEYDIRELLPDPFPPRYFVDYLNTPKVQKAIGAFVNFTRGSSFVSGTFATTGDDDREDGTVEATRQLLSQNVTVVWYFGDADYICNWVGGEAIVLNLLDPPAFSTAGYADIVTPDNITHGQVRQAANFAFARIYYSGHEVPFYQPVVALSLFNRTIHGLDIATGTVQARMGGGYVTKGPQTSTFREGNGTVIYEVLDPSEWVYDVNLNMPVMIGMIGNGTKV